MDRNARNLLGFLRVQGIELEAAAFLREFHRRRERAYEVARATRVEYLAQRSLEQALATMGHQNLDGDLLTEGVKALFEYEESRWRLFPDALFTLEALQRAGYSLALISNASDDGFIQRLLRAHRLEPYLHPAINSARAGIRKPDPSLFQRVLEDWDLEPDEVAMVGDSLEFDILGAHLAGMRGILARMDENPANDQVRDTVHPDATIENLGQLPTLLTTWHTEEEV